MSIHVQEENRCGHLLPLIVTVIVAAVGMAGILYNLGPANDLQASGKARRITAAAVSRAGAIEIPSAPRAPAGATKGVSA